MRFLFIHPKICLKGEYYQFPLGLAYISSYMKSLGFDSYCLNLCHDDRPVAKQMQDALLDNSIDIVCTGGLSIMYHEINQVIQAAKKINPSVKTVVGGAIVTSDPQLASQAIKFDIGVIGEGEKTMAELAEALINGRDLSEVKGLIYKKKQESGYSITKPRTPIMDLDKLPFPDYEGFGLDEYIQMGILNNTYLYYSVLDIPRCGSIISSRSCCYNCTFCYHPLGRRYRQRSIKNVMKEVDYLVKKYKINLLFVNDELFCADKKRALQFCLEIKKYDLKWVPQMRVPDMDRNTLSAMKDSGVYAISCGIESISEKILKSMKKKITPSQINQGLSLARKNNIGPKGNLIFGDPEETKDTVRESLDWWEKHPEYSVTLYMLKVLPDSEIYRYAVKKGLIRDKLKYMANGFPIINVSKLPKRFFNKIHTLTHWYMSAKSPIPCGRVIKSSVTGHDSMGRPIFTVSVKCPECNSETVYKQIGRQSFLGFRGYLQMFCRQCFHKVNLKTRDLFPDSYKIHNNSLFKIILLYTLDLVYKYKWLFTLVNKLRLRFVRISSLYAFYWKLSKR